MRAPRFRPCRLGRALPLCLLALAACRGGGQLRRGEEAARAYNVALAEAYRTSDASALRAVATPKELKKVIALIDLKRSAGLVLESTLESLAATSVRSAGPDAMVVETRERWRYFDRPLRPGASAGPTFVAEMTLRYQFLRQEGAWKMDQGKTLSCAYLEPKGFAPGAPAAGGEHGGKGEP